MKQNQKIRSICLFTFEAKFCSFFSLWETGSRLWIQRPKFWLQIDSANRVQMTEGERTTVGVLVQTSLNQSPYLLPLYYFTTLIIFWRERRSLVPVLVYLPRTGLLNRIPILATLSCFLLANLTKKFGWTPKKFFREQEQDPERKSKWLVAI